MNLVRITRFIRENRDEICKGCSRLSSQSCWIHNKERYSSIQQMLNKNSNDFITRKYKSIFTQKICPEKRQKGK